MRAAATQMKAFAKQSDDANTAATVRMRGKRAHTSASLITTCYGDEAGTGGGVDSGTHNGVCRPKSWSNKVFIEGHHAVRDGDEWSMNNGNTTGILSFKVRPHSEQAPKEGDGAEENSLPEDIDPTVTASTAAAPPLDGYGNLKGSIEYNKLLQRGKDLLREAGNIPLGKIGKVAKYATGAGAFLGTLFEMNPSYRGAFSDQWVSHKGLDPSFDEIYHSALAQLDEIESKGLHIDGKQWLDHWNSILSEYQSRVMVGDFGETSQAIAATAAAGLMPEEMKDRFNRDRLIVTGALAAAVAFQTCQHLACPKAVGPYKGGAHWCTSQPIGDGLDSHHMPAKGYGNKFPPAYGPAIQMTPADHKMTASNPASRALGKNYNKQAAHLAVGQNYAAFLEDVRDIEDVERRIGQPGKYAEAVAQASIYMNCLKANKWVQ